MPLPKNRSTKYRKISRKTTHGAKIVFLKRKKTGASCGVCGAQLAGIKRGGSKTQKSVSRMFGGSLCHKCSERVIKEAMRVREKVKSIEEIDLIYRKYVEPLIK